MSGYKPLSSTGDDGTELQTISTSVVDETEPIESNNPPQQAPAPAQPPRRVMMGFGNVSSYRGRGRPGIILFQGIRSRPEPEMTPGDAARFEREERRTPSLLSMETFWNIVWMLLFGWWLPIFYLVAALILYVSVVGLPYGHLCLQMAYFLLWPFNKYILRISHPRNQNVVSLEESSGVGFSMFALVSLFTILPAHLLSWCGSWFTVVYIPMAKMHKNMLSLLFMSNPLELVISSDPQGDTQLCTHCSFNWGYHKYKVWGVDVMLFSKFVSLRSCLSTAVENIAMQTNFVIGALVNASFGSIIELLLYWALMRNAGPDKLIQYTVTGTLLGMLLLMPGVCMIVGGLKHKDQRFSAQAAGVSSVLLIVSIIGAFTPTVFYQIHGGYQLECRSCNSTAMWGSTHALDCQGCQLQQPCLERDPVYLQHVRPLMHKTALLLPVAYLIGLLFTHFTHQHLFREDHGSSGDVAESGNSSTAELPSSSPSVSASAAVAALGDHSPKPSNGNSHAAHHDGWSMRASIIVLFVCVALFAAIAEEMVDTMTPTFELLGIDPKFAGLTFLAIVPSIAEYAAAILFAYQDNISLSIEIGSSAAVQLALIQVPALVLISWLSSTGPDMFTLVFPTLDLFAVIFAVIIVNYVSTDGRSNYFIGGALVMIYILLILAFWHLPPELNPCDSRPDLNGTSMSLSPQQRRR